jgi:hypothetical protein
MVYVAQLLPLLKLHSNIFRKIYLSKTTDSSIPTILGVALNETLLFQVGKDITKSRL